MKKSILNFGIIFFILIFTIEKVFSDEKLIIPLKKPLILDNNAPLKISNYVIPLKKPTTEKKKIKLEKKEKKVVQGQIIPKSKPLIVKTKKTKKTKKSKFYSKKDFSIANQAIQYMEQKKWSSAEKTAKKARDKSIYNFIRWRHLITTGNQLNFFDYRNFIESNPNYPRINRVKYLGEHKINSKVYLQISTFGIP
jgi:hypothetical protein